MDTKDTVMNQQPALNLQLLDDGHVVITSGKEEALIVVLEPVTGSAIVAAILEIAKQYFSDQEKKRQLSDLKDYIRDSIQKAVDDIKRYIDQTNEQNIIRACQDSVTAAFGLMDQYQQSDNPKSALNKTRLANAVIRSTDAITILTHLGPTKAFGAFLQAVSLFTLSIVLEYKNTNNRNELRNLKAVFDAADSVIAAFEKEVNDLRRSRVDGVSPISRSGGDAPFPVQYCFYDTHNPGYCSMFEAETIKERNARINLYNSIEQETIKNIITPARALQAEWHKLWEKCKKLLPH